MNGTWLNYITHFLLSVVMVGVLFLAVKSLPPLMSASLLSVLLWWHGEAKERSGQHANNPDRRRVISDYNPFDRTWNKDDRLDFLSHLAGAIVAVLVLVPLT